MATEPNYGSDIAVTVNGGRIDLDSTFRLVSGTEMMAQRACRRLYCRKGRLLSDPNDNTLDARDFVSQGLAANNAGLSRIRAQCQSALLGDPCIFTALVTPTYDTRTRALDLACKGTGAFGPFALTLRVTELTVELLRPS